MKNLHEATLAENILEIAFKAAPNKKILAVGLTLGEMAGVEVDSLSLSFDILKKNTPADRAELKIKRIPITATCNKCHKTFRLNNYNFFCPECDGILILQSGKELLVEFVDCE